VDYLELKEHTTILVSLVGTLASLVGFLFWRLVSRMEAKIDEIVRLCCHCRETLGERFANRSEYEQHERDHLALWEALNYHDHARKGRGLR
jgi:hypothetical protein